MRTRRLDAAALVIGSMAPDFAYFLPQFPYAHLSHNPFGLLLFNLPIGLVLYGCYRAWVRSALLAASPAAIRERFDPEPAPREGHPLAVFALLCLSLLLGAATHLAWDSLTHKWGLPRVSPALQTLVNIGGLEIAVHRIIQHLSTAFGLYCLFYYVRGLPRRSHAASERSALPAPMAVLFWVAVALPAAACALFFANGLWARIVTTLSVGLFAFAVATLLVFARTKYAALSSR